MKKKKPLKKDTSILDLPEEKEPEVSAFPRYSQKTSNLFVVTLPKIPGYIVHSYYPPSTGDELSSRVVKFWCDEPSDVNLLQIIQSLNEPGIDNFEIIVDILDGVGNQIETHRYVSCYLSGFNYPPFQVDLAEVRRVGLLFTYERLEFV